MSTKYFSKYFSGYLVGKSGRAMVVANRFRGSCPRPQPSAFDRLPPARTGGTLPHGTGNLRFFTGHRSMADVDGSPSTSHQGGMLLRGVA